MKSRPKKRFFPINLIELLVFFALTSALSLSLVRLLEKPLTYHPSLLLTQVANPLLGELNASPTPPPRRPASQDFAPQTAAPALTLAPTTVAVTFQQTSTTLSKIETLSFSCSEPALLPAMAKRVRLKGTLCAPDQLPENASLRLERANSKIAEVFYEPKSHVFSTEYFQLEPGRNRVHLRILQGPNTHPLLPLPEKEAFQSFEIDGPPVIETPAVVTPPETKPKLKGDAPPLTSSSNAQTHPQFETELEDEAELEAENDPERETRLEPPHESGSEAAGKQENPSRQQEEASLQLTPQALVGYKTPPPCA